MIVLEYFLRIKFRAFGITFGTFEKAGALPVTSARDGVAADAIWRTVIDERGVLLRVRVVKQENTACEGE